MTYKSWWQLYSNRRFLHTGEVPGLLVFMFKCICSLFAPMEIFSFDWKRIIIEVDIINFELVKNLKQLMKFPSAGIFLKETIIKLSKMSHFKVFRRKHHWGSSSSDIYKAPLPPLPTVGPSSALEPQQTCETCSHKGFWAYGPHLGNL